MAKFDIGETVICSCQVKDDDGNYKDPNDDYTHTTITIIDKNSVKKIADVVMTRDSIGKYHYDCQTTSYVDGKYRAEYKATDGSRITIEKETFELE